MDVTDETFESQVVELSHELPVIVDFWADWCAPCRTLTPILEREVASRGGGVQLAKVDVDANPELARRFGIRGIPAVKGFRNGKVVREFVGVQSPQTVASFVDALAAPSPAEELLSELRASGEAPELVAALDAGDYEGVLERLLGAVPAADAERREWIRGVMVALFDVLGHDHPLTERFRRRLATALY